MDPVETLKSLAKAALSISNLQEKADIPDLVNKAQTGLPVVNPQAPPTEPDYGA